MSLSASYQVIDRSRVLLPTALAIAAALFFAAMLGAQGKSKSALPIAIVPLDSNNPNSALSVTGALEISQGKAIIASSGSVISGSKTTEVVLPRRGVLRVCAATTVRLTTDTSVPAGEVPGLMMGLSHGAIEASFATGRNSDILLTPDFRILISGPGAADVKVRLGQHGDTCVDNAGVNSPYVLVTSVFDGSTFRVQSGQRVMFQHGSLQEVVDQEKEPCGCPPTDVKGNEFPLAQSEGLAPLAETASTTEMQDGSTTYPVEPLVANRASHDPAPSIAKQEKKPKHGFFAKLRKFFLSIFGAE